MVSWNRNESHHSISISPMVTWTEILLFEVLVGPDHDVAIHRRQQRHVHHDDVALLPVASVFARPMMTSM